MQGLKIGDACTSFKLNIQMKNIFNIPPQRTCPSGLSHYILPNPKLHTPNSSLPKPVDQTIPWRETPVLETVRSAVNRKGFPARGLPVGENGSVKAVQSTCEVSRNIPVQPNQCVKGFSKKNEKSKI